MPSSSSFVVGNKFGVGPHVAGMAHQATRVLLIREPSMPSKSKEAFIVFVPSTPTETTPSYEDIMNKNTRLREARKLIVEWRKANVIEQTTPREYNRISSKVVFGLPGSATEDQGLAKLKAKEDVKAAAELATISKKEQAKQKKAQETTTLVTTSSELIKNIEQHGPLFLNYLKIDELHALLVHSDPQGHVPRPSKKQIGFEKVAELTTAKASIFRHFANFVAATQPQPHPHLPPIAPSLLGEQQRFSISSVGSSGVLSQPETDVVPMSENVAVQVIDRSVSNHVQNLGTQ
jgi:hypothetical protein